MVVILTVSRVQVWALLNYDYSIHAYKEGVLRTGSAEYSLDDLTDTFVHLSNHCIQENHPAYGQYEPTNEMWYGQFDEYLKSITNGEVGFYTHIQPKIHSIIEHSLMAVKDLMHVSCCSYRSFNLFGFDFMVTDDFDVQLIEINSSPAVAADLLPALTQDLIELAIEPMCPRPENAPPRAPAADAGGYPFDTGFVQLRAGDEE